MKYEFQSSHLKVEASKIKENRLKGVNLKTRFEAFFESSEKIQIHHEEE